MSDAGDDVGPFIRRYVQVARRRWPLAPPAAPPALGEAHRLLSDVELEEAVKSAGFAWGKKLYGEPRWPRDGHGQYMRPWLNYIALHAREWVLDALSDGRLCARAIDPDDPIRGKPFTIQAERWALLTPDWKRSTATCEGKLVAIAITVESAECQPQAPGTRPADRVYAYIGEFRRSTRRDQQRRPVYKINDAAQEVGIRPGEVTRLISSGEFNYIEVLPSLEYWKPSICITGWQLIDYREYLMRCSAHRAAEARARPGGAP